MTDRETWETLGRQLRIDSIRASSAAGSGHPTSSMSAADLMAVLLERYLRYDFETPDRPTNDHLVFSKGHASPLLYALYRAAGAIDDEALLSYRQHGSRFEGHPTPVLPWVDVATGSLGQGLPIAVGIALAGKRLDRLPYRVWVLTGDGELAEGSMWEAFEHAAFAGLDNLTAIIDVNRLGQTRETMHGWDLDLYGRRLTAFGWHVIEVDGHDVDAIAAAYGEAVEVTGRPTAIVARTIKGSGVSEVADRNGMHGKALDAEHEERALAELGAATHRPADRRGPQAAGRRAAAPLSCGPPRAAAIRAWARWRRRGGRMPRRSWPSVARAARSSPSTAMSTTRPTRSCSRKRSPSATSRCTSPSNRWPPPRSASRFAAGSRSPRRTGRSGAGPSTSSGWPR